MQNYRPFYPLIITLQLISFACGAEKTDESAATKAISETPPTPVQDKPSTKPDTEIIKPTNDTKDAPLKPESPTSPTSGEPKDETEPVEKPAELEKPKDKNQLLDEAKTQKTPDDQALVALTEAEKLGATISELAKIANQRGEKLFDKSERAQKFFEWARDKDPKYAEPSFNLAKLSALQGDVEQTLSHLEEVHKRGGKKLLKTAEIDPIFEVVKDDPKFQSMLR